jgi:hypothetical protein
VANDGCARFGAREHRVGAGRTDDRRGNERVLSEPESRIENPLTRLEVPGFDQRVGEPLDQSPDPLERHAGMEADRGVVIRVNDWSRRTTYAAAH